MAELNAPIYNFKGGVLGRKLLGRTDLKLSREGLLTGHNFITELQGPQRFRAGDKFVKLTRDNLPATFWEFVFSDDQAFVLAFTDYRLSFFTNEGAIVETAKTITAITQANPAVITAPSHGYSSGDEVFIGSVSGMTEVNRKFFYVAYIDANNFSLKDVDGNDIDSSAFSAYVSGGEVKRVYTIETPYTEAQARQLKFAGRDDILYLVDGVHLPRKLARLGNANWTLTTFFRNNDPFEANTISNITQANPAVVTTVTNHGLSSGDIVFIEDVVGMTEVNNFYFEINVTATDEFELVGIDSSAYAAYSSAGQVSLQGNAPVAVGMYGGSLYYAGTDNDPDFFWKSRSPDPSTGAPRLDDFTVGSDPEDSVSLPIESIGTGTARVRWLVGTRNFLAVGMYSGLSKINGGEDGVPVTNVDVGTFPIDAYGVSKETPAFSGTDFVYVQRGGENVFNFQFSLLNNGFESFDAMLQNDNIAEAGIKQITYQQSRPDLVWFLLENGELLSFTYRRSETVAAWNTHSVAKSSAGAAVVHSICRQPQDNNEDRLWKCTKRVINGVERYHVEVSADNPAIPEKDDFFSGFGLKSEDEDKFLGQLWESQKRQVFLDAALILDTEQSGSVTPGATSGEGVTFTASSSIFSSSDIGRQIRMKLIEGDEKGIAEITNYLSPTQVECSILEDFESTDIITSGKWYFTQNIINNLEHLEGEEISIVEDGALATNKTVVNGSVTLDSQVTYAVAGLSYFGILQTMPIDLLLSSGISVGKYKSSGKAKMLFRNTMGASYGTDLYDLNDIKYRNSAIGGRAVPYFNGWEDVPAFDNYGIDRTYYVVQKRPYPCEVQALVFDMEIPFDGAA